MLPTQTKPKQIETPKNQSDRIITHTQLIDTRDFPAPRTRFKWMIVCSLLLVSLVLNGILLERYEVIPKLLYRLEPGPVWPPVALGGRYEIETDPMLAFADCGVEDEETFRQWQRQAREKLQEILRVDVTIHAESVRSQGKVQVGDITRETLVLHKHDGSQIPGFLLLPDASEPRPVVIVIPSHSYGIIDTAGIIEDFQHSVALRLAEAGYVVLTLERRGTGYLQSMGKYEIGMDACTSYYVVHGRCMASYTVADAAAGLNYVLSREEADSEQVGVMGFSSGGFPAVFLGALDDRIDAVVAGGCITSFDSLILDAGKHLGMTVPGLIEWLDASDCLSLLAPRPMLAQWGQLDEWPQVGHGSLTPSSWTTIDAAKCAYSVLNSQRQLETHVSPNLRHEVDTPVVVDFFLRVMPINKRHHQGWSANSPAATRSAHPGLRGAETGVRRSDKSLGCR